MLDKIRKAGENNLVVVPVGVGSAFAKKNYNSSFILSHKGETLLVDMGRNIPDALHDEGIKVTDFDYYYFTHAHADHVGGLEELLFMGRYVTKIKPRILISNRFKNELWNKTLSGGIAKSELPELSFEDLAEQIKPKYSGNQSHLFSAGPFEIYSHYVGHVSNPMFWSSNLIINKSIYISGDSVFEPATLEAVRKANDIRLFFHDCQLFSPGLVHASFDELKTLPVSIKEKMVLYHYGDNWEDFDEKAEGFIEFAEPWKVYE
jgi:ribonuclease BN (tRNA processing enzyme)